MAKNTRPIIIKRIEESGHGGHHGGAWKVAYADFVTAMMAFFLLLWLISSASQETLKGLAQYFSDASTNVGVKGGPGGVLEGATFLPPEPFSPQSPPAVIPSSLPPLDDEVTDGEVPALSEEQEQDQPAPAPAKPAGMTDAEFAAERERREQAMFAEAKEAIGSALDKVPELQDLKKNLLIDRTPEGLRIQLVDRDKAPMFPVGSTVMYPRTRQLLEVVTKAIARLPNRILIRGHTDALAFAPGAAYDNWQLSSDRANSTRRALVDLGLDPARVAEVAGRGAAEPLLPDNPGDPRNRRITLVLLEDKPKP